VILQCQEARSTCDLIKPLSAVLGHDSEAGGLLTVPGNANEGPKLRRSQSRAFLSEDGMPQPIEFFVASDASAVIEQTKRVLYLEDDDIAHISEGGRSKYTSICVEQTLIGPLLPSRASHSPTSKGRRPLFRASH
jgi:glucosamine 6-phosphate synthetase-like amidotransferase/phosphosugar isomerase protein